MYTAGSRQETSNKKTPGPGDYYPIDGSVQRKGETYKVGTEERALLKITNTNPGPGDHESRGQLAGPKYSFGQGLGK
jgi:hypothetical protein